MTAPRPRTRHVAIAAAGFFMVYLTWLISGRSQGRALMVADDVVLVAVSVPPLVLSFLAARSTRGRLRTAWSALTLGLLSWNLGELVWTYCELAGVDLPVPSPADAFFLFWPVAVCVALLRFWNRAPQHSYSRILLDAVIVGGSLFLVAWLLSIHELYRTRAATTMEFVVAMAYPFTDWIMVTVAAIVLTYAQARLRRVLTLITLGLMSMAVNDSGYAYLSALFGYSGADILNAGWVAGLLLLTVAAAYGREATTDEDPAVEMPGWTSVWLPYVPLLLTVGILAYEPADVAGTALVRFVGALLFVTVLARQFLAVRENRRLLAVVAEQSLHDPLTGLPNRVLFHDRLNHAMQLRARDDQSLSVLAVDLDDFKLVNDTLGHAAGDELLVAVADRLRGAVRSGDTVSRLGGDEFGVILEGPAVTAEPIARRVVAAFDAPFIVDGREVRIQPSVGMAVSGNAGSNSNQQVSELLKRADMAMYAAKRSRDGDERSGLWRFSEGVSADRAQGAGADAVQLLDELRQAIDRRELTLVYQPKFSLNTTAMVGVEALLRWPRRDGGSLGPDEFLPLVRRHGLIGPVTDFVLTRTLDDAALWYAAGAAVPVAINLFPPSLVTPNLPERISRELGDRGLSPSALTVEITEDMVLDNVTRARSVLSDLRSRGILVAIDDFGSGYSALSYLRDLPVDEVKLDRDFIGPIAHDPRASAVARAVIDVAHVLCLTTVAEGVENIETVNCLRELGCDVVQGYFYSSPLTAEQVLELAGQQVLA